MYNCNKSATANLTIQTWYGHVLREERYVVMCIHFNIMHIHEEQGLKHDNFLRLVTLGLPYFPDRKLQWLSMGSTVLHILYKFDF